MTYGPILLQVDSRLKKINGIQHSWQVEDFVMPTETENTLLISERGEDADLAICLQKDLLDELSGLSFPNDFSLKVFPRVSLLVEELSHFHFYCVNATHQRKISALEMEVQAEVDKFSFALDCLEEMNLRNLEDDVFGILFNQLQLGPWVKSEERSRYQEAHQIARAFCRKLLRSTTDRSATIQEFYRMSPEERLNPK